MKPARPAITILIHRDGDVDSRSLRVPLWLFRTALGIVGTVLVLILLGAVLYLPIAGVAARVPGLRSEIAALREENAQIRRLVETVDSLESQYSKVRGMLGADLGTRLPNTSAVPQAPTIVVDGSSLDSITLQGGVLTRWPLAELGYITRGQLGAGENAAHTGVDIAVPVGTPVRVAGTGSVVEAARDQEYGLFVLVRHDDGFATRYAHLSRIVVTAGKSLLAGEVIGLSGNSGRSSAPHLHFEITQRGQSIDPRKLLQEGR
jgi:murein DD-endopeptidase MepM/ murein hydrolase activator NlpD